MILSFDLTIYLCAKDNRGKVICSFLSRVGGYEDGHGVQ